MVNEPKFEDMKTWAERAYKLELNEIPSFIEEIISNYDHTSISKINLVVVSVVSLLKKFYESKIIDMTDAEVDQSRWILVKSIIPGLGDGAISVVTWNRLLSPTSEPYFNTIPFEIWEQIKENAKLLTEQHERGAKVFSQVELEHWEKILNDQVPFGYKVLMPDTPDHDE